VPPRTFATIDVGTNTALLLVARADAAGAITVLDERAEITRLGRGIGQMGAGGLGAEGIARTLDALRAYAALARAHGAHVAAVGTEALRRAPNGADFLAPAAEILGAPVEVIDGAREAALTFRAAAASFADLAAGAMVVVDIGGGSTEIILSERGDVRWSTSLPLGSVRLTEKHVRHDPPARAEREAIATEVDAALAAVPWPAAPPALVGVAGTVTSLAAMALRLASYDAARVHGFALSLAALDAEIARLESSPQAERERIVGLDPKRADVILAGALILRRIAAAARAPAIRVSDRGIRWGLLHELVLAEGASPLPRAHPLS
jgi:exopolyphosphatase/guanosine-5'-triphosphate,3'-diphosphate pyrophosphatase